MQKIRFCPHLLYHKCLDPCFNLSGRYNPKILDKNEKQKLGRGFVRAKEILKNAGAKGIFKTQYLAAHPGGTVKVGDILDSNLMTKYDNLHVCDCSVIPEAWGMPPTKTIIGLGKRLAKYLSREKK